MFKTLLMALLIFLGMVGFDAWKNENKSAPPPVQKQEQQVTKKENPPKEETKEDKKMSEHEKKAVRAVFLAILPDKKEWPEPIRKVYTAFNLDETIDPIRQRPNWVPLKNMAQDLPRALISIEDKDFYKHGAIAYESILRAAIENATAGKVVQGGSTLTQQLVKNLFLTQAQNLGRKVEEAILSLVMERQYSKDEIIELYLNTTYFGAGAYGIKEASYKYFDKAPSSLSLAECAVIAALPNAPSALNPLENPLGCRKRQILVLTKMQEYGHITQAQVAEAKNERIYLTNGKTFQVNKNAECR